MLVFISSLFVKLFTFGDDTISTIISQQIVEEMEPMHLNESGYIPSYMLLHVMN